MEVFVLSWWIQGSFVLPGFVSSGADLLLVLWDYGAFLWFVFFVFFLFVLWQKSSSRVVFWGRFLLVSPAFLVRSTVCCRVLYDTRPSTDFPVFFRSSRRQPRPCWSSMLGAWLARVGEVSSLGRACGPRFLFLGCVRCCPVFSGGRLCRDFSGDGVWPPRVVSPATEFLPDGGSVVLSVFCAVCVIPCCLCVSQCLCSAQIFTGLICSVEL